VGKAFDNDLLEVANNRGEDEGDDEEVDEEDIDCRQKNDNK
jgi:hypothetical protein